MPNDQPRYQLCVPPEIVAIAKREAEAHRPRLSTSQILLEALYKVFGPNLEREGRRIENAPFR